MNGQYNIIKTIKDEVKHISGPEGATLSAPTLKLDTMGDIMKPVILLLDDRHTDYNGNICEPCDNK